MKVIDIKNPQEGIKELRYIDPLKMKFIRQEKKQQGGKFDNGNVRTEIRRKLTNGPEFEEYFQYTPNQVQPTGILSLVVEVNQ